MKSDGVHKMINKAKPRAMLLQLEALSIAESTGLYQSHLDTARLDLSEPNDQGQRPQLEQSAVEAQGFEEQSHLHQKHRNVIETLPFWPYRCCRTGPTEARPAGGLTVDFVVVPDRAQLSEIVRRASADEHRQRRDPR